MREGTRDGTRWNLQDSVKRVRCAVKARDHDSRLHCLPEQQDGRRHERDLAIVLETRWRRDWNKRSIKIEGASFIFVLENPIKVARGPGRHNGKSRTCTLGEYGDDKAAKQNTQAQIEVMVPKLSPTARLQRCAIFGQNTKAEEKAETPYDRAGVPSKLQSAFACLGFSYSQR